MSIKEQFYNRRPLALFDPRGALRLDPRYTFTRASSATFVDSAGIIRAAAANEPRLTYDPTTGDSLGFLVEESRTNSLFHSSNFDASSWAKNNSSVLDNQVVAPDNTLSGAKIVENTEDGEHGVSQIRGLTGVVTFSIFVKPAERSSCAIQFFSSADGTRTSTYDLTGEGAITSAPLDHRTTIQLYPFGWYRISMTSFQVSGNTRYRIRMGTKTTTGMYTGDGSSGLFLWGAQLEASINPTSYIATNSTFITRAADILSLNTQDIPTTGSIYIDARASTAANNETLLSVANDSDEKLELSIESNADLFNSPALIYQINGNFEPALPFPVPLPGDQRNLITFGKTNTHYQVGFSRKTPTLASAVPEDMNRLGIGHDVTDPTKGFNGTISRLYLWPGEIPPEIARGLVRGDFQLIDAASPNLLTPDAHSLVFNTQGLTLTGDREVTFQLLGANNSVTIDWGDGTTEAYSGAAANGTISHIYTSAGIYLVQITGPFENIRFGGFTNSQASDLIAVQQTSPDWTPTNLNDLYNGAALLTDTIFDNFPSTTGITSFDRAFSGLSELTTFPQLDTSSATTLNSTWAGCTKLTTFPQIDTANVANFSIAWRDCVNLTSFPLLNTSSGTNFNEAWYGCTNLEAFPLIDTSNANTLVRTWRECRHLIEFPLLDLSSCTDVSEAWRNCLNLTSFPLVDTSSCTNFFAAWFGCNSLTSFPVLDSSSVTVFRSAWYNCAGLQSFPLLDTSSATNFRSCWHSCTALTEFPALDFSSVVGSGSADTDNGFRLAWFGCSNLSVFPANRFDDCQCTQFVDAFTSCALNSQSIENILVSINTANTSDGVLSLQGGTNAQKVNWTQAANDAYDALIARGWTITFRA